jgi:hypothetical protein
VKLTVMNTDITNLATKFVWSGDYQQLARALEISVAVSPTDGLLPRVSVSLGNMAKLFDDDGNELFRGYIFSKDKTASGSEITYKAYDGFIYLTKSKGTYNFKSITAEAITRKVAGDFGVSIGSLAATGIVISSLVEDAQAISDIIKTAYEKAGAQNGKSYLLQMSKGALNVVEKGSTTVSYVLSESTNVTDSEYSENLEDMINRVKVYDSDGNYVKTVSNSTWVSNYGILQDTYTKEDGVDATTAANNMLKGITYSGTVSGLGNINCVTGRKVTIKEPYTGISGSFYINTDTHTWENNQYTMELTLDLA